MVACQSQPLQIVKLSPDKLTGKAADMPDPAEICPVTVKDTKSVRGLACVDYGAIEEEAKCAGNFDQDSLARTLNKRNVVKIDRPLVIIPGSDCAGVKGILQLSIERQKRRDCLAH